MAEPFSINIDQVLPLGTKRHENHRRSVLVGALQPRSVSLTTADGTGGSLEESVPFLVLVSEDAVTPANGGL